MTENWDAKRYCRSELAPIPYSVFKNGTELVPNFDEPIEEEAKIGKTDRQDSWDRVLAGESYMAVWRDVFEGDGLGAALTSNRKDSSSVGLEIKQKGQHRAWEV